MLQECVLSPVPLRRSKAQSTLPRAVQSSALPPLYTEAASTSRCLGWIDLDTGDAQLHECCIVESGAQSVVLKYNTAAPSLGLRLTGGGRWRIYADHYAVHGEQQAYLYAVE